MTDFKYIEGAMHGRGYYEVRNARGTLAGWIRIKFDQTGYEFVRVIGKGAQTYHASGAYSQKDVDRKLALLNREVKDDS